MNNSTNASQAAGFSFTPSNSLANAANPSSSGQLFANESGQTPNNIFGVKAQGQSSPFGAISVNGGPLGSKDNIFNNNSNNQASSTNNNQTSNNLFNNSNSNNASQQASSNNALQTIGAKSETPSFSVTNTPMFGGAKTAETPNLQTNSQSPAANLFNGQK